MKPLANKKAKQKCHNRKNTQDNMMLASLNMRGRYSDNGTTDKWRDINQYMKESKINLLTVQETHLTQEDVDNIHELQLIISYCIRSVTPFDYALSCLMHNQIV
jgi:hypothetical protein